MSYPCEKVVGLYGTRLFWRVEMSHFELQKIKNTVSHFSSQQLANDRKDHVAIASRRCVTHIPGISPVRSQCPTTLQSIVSTTVQIVTKLTDV